MTRPNIFSCRGTLQRILPEPASTAPSAKRPRIRTFPSEVPMIILGSRVEKRHRTAPVRRSSPTMVLVSRGRQTTILPTIKGALPSLSAFRRSACTYT